MNKKNKDKEFYTQAFCRNIGLLSTEEQKCLQQTKVAIAGMGGVGGLHLLTLTRLGIGRFHIADEDKFELVNFNRQVGATISTIGQPKSEVMQKMALEINPYLDIKLFPAINEGNIDAFLQGVDVAVDGLDFFNIKARRLLFKKAQEKNIYALTAGPVGFSTAFLIFAPDSMSFDEYFDIKDEMDYLDKIIAFAVGLAPKGLHLQYMNLGSVNLKTGKGPSIFIACELCAALMGMEVLNIVLKRKKPKAVPYYVQFDPYLKKYKKGYLLWGNRHPVQRLKRWIIRNFLFKGV